MGLLINKLRQVYLLSVGVKFFLISEYMAKLQTRAWLSHALCAPGQHTAKNEESARDNTHFRLTPFF